MTVEIQENGSQIVHASWRSIAVRPLSYCSTAHRSLLTVLLLLTAHCSLLTVFAQPGVPHAELAALWRAP